MFHGNQFLHVSWDKGKSRYIFDRLKQNNIIFMELFYAILLVEAENCLILLNKIYNQIIIINNGIKSLQNAKKCNSLSLGIDNIKENFIWTHIL